MLTHRGDAIEEGILQDEWAMMGEEDDAVLRTANLFECVTVVGMEDGGKYLACLDGVACCLVAHIDACMTCGDIEEVILVEEEGLETRSGDCLGGDANAMEETEHGGYGLLGVVHIDAIRATCIDAEG